MYNKSQTETRSLVLTAILTALVIVLQYMGSFIKFGPFSISLVLIPIVIGASICGVKSGAWLGFVFGVFVLVSGDAAPFLAVNPLGTIITVIVKGILAGLISGFIFNITQKVNIYFGAIASAIVCPIVNTGIFLIGCCLFFMETITTWATAAGFGSNTGAYMILVLVGGNFIFELLVNVVLSPIIVRLLKIKK